MKGAGSSGVPSMRRATWRVREDGKRTRLWDFQEKRPSATEDGRAAIREMAGATHKETNTSAQKWSSHSGEVELVVMIHCLKHWEDFGWIPG